MSSSVTHLYPHDTSQGISQSQQAKMEPLTWHYVVNRVFSGLQIKGKWLKVHVIQYTLGDLIQISRVIAKVFCQPSPVLVLSFWPLGKQIIVTRYWKLKDLYWKKKKVGAGIWQESLFCCSFAHFNQFYTIGKIAVRKQGACQHKSKIIGGDMKVCFTSETFLGVIKLPTAQSIWLFGDMKEISTSSYFVLPQVWFLDPGAHFSSACFPSFSLPDQDVKPWPVRIPGSGSKIKDHSEHPGFPLQP